MTSISSSSSRMVWLDALRILAGVSMICMHASFDWNGQPFPDFPPDQRVIPVAMRTFFYMARTELFLIISLFLLAMSLDRRPRSYGDTVKEQAKRLLIPYVFWLVLYIVFNFFKAWQLGYLVYLWRDLTTMVDPWAKYILLGSIRPQMHFLPTLFALVLFFPLYRYAVRYPILGLVVFALLYAKRELNILIYDSVAEVYAPYALRVVRIVTYTGYGFVGAAFYGLMVRSEYARWRLPVLIGMVVIGAWALNVKYHYVWAVVENGHWTHNFPGRYWANLLLPAVLFGVLMLVPIRYPKWIEVLAPYSFGIFLCHPLFLDVFHIVVRDSIGNPTLYVWMKLVWGVSMSFLLIWWMGRQPWLAWTVGLGKLPDFGRYFRRSHTALLP